MYPYSKVSSQEVLSLIQYVVGAVAKYNRPVAVAVCGPEGELLGFLRMDGTSPTGARNAQNKAYTAAVSRSETLKMGQRMRGTDNPAFWGDKRVTGFGGGVPIIHDSVVIGGIGVSGLPEADDHEVATSAINAVYKKV
jgi:glc operon protein GlcG